MRNPWCERRMRRTWEERGGVGGEIELLGRLGAHEEGAAAAQGVRPRGRDARPGGVAEGVDGHIIA